MPLLELEPLVSEAKAEVLRLLLLDPQRSFYQREVAERTGLRIRAVQQALEPLVDAGILLREKRGSQVFYRANADCPVMPELTGLIVKTVGIARPLRDALEPLSDEIAVALLFGSFASGQFRPDSDIDLLVVGSASPRAVMRALRPAAAALGREINPVAMSVDEFRERVSSGDHFITSVLNGQTTFILGGSDELAELARAGTDRPTGACS